MDPAKAERELGWRSTIDLSEGLRETYAALVEEFEAAASASGRG
jgi:nucleoside-diphosphate-sugar epimerase